MKSIKKWLTQWLISKVNYPTPVIPDKPLAVIQELDQLLVAGSTPNNYGLCIENVVIPLRSQVWSLEKIIKTIKLPKNHYYIPRSIAFYVDADGNWVILYGIRSPDHAPTSELTNNMFIELLTRTNNAR
jgi:hypothetical protein